MKLHGLGYIAGLKDRIGRECVPDQIMDIPGCLDRLCGLLADKHVRVVRHPTEDRDIKVPVSVAWAAAGMRHPAMPCANPDELHIVKWYTTLYAVDCDAALLRAPAIQQWHQTYRPDARVVGGGLGNRTRDDWLGIEDIRKFAQSEAGGCGAYDACFQMKCGFKSTLAGWHGDFGTQQSAVHDRHWGFPPVAP